MAKNQITLTFAGDSKQLERTFGKVGSSAKTMGTSVGSASKTIRDTGPAFDRAGTAADNLDTKAMGFRDTITGVQDTMLGTSQIAQGNLAQGFLTLGTGISDLASGTLNLLIPALKSMSLSMFATGAAAVKSAAVQTAAWAKLGVQSLLHAAKVALAWLIAMGPIALVIAAVVGVAALIVKNWGTIKAVTMRVFQAVWGFLKNIWSNITGFVGGAVNRMKEVFMRFHPLGIFIRNFNPIMAFVRSIPGKIGSALGGLARAVAAPFRAAFQGIRNVWNATIGGRGFSTPGWLPPPLGNRSFRIPRLHTGGVMPGVPGSEGLALLQAGERVTPAGRDTQVVIRISSGGTRLDDLLVEVLRRSIRARGGNVQIALGE